MVQLKLPELIFVFGVFLGSLNKNVVVGNDKVCALLSLGRIVGPLGPVDPIAIIVDVEVPILSDCHGDVLVVVVEDELVVGNGFILVVGLFASNLFGNVLAILDKLVERVRLIVE